MPITRYNTGWDYLKATALWVLVGMSLGVYYVSVSTWPVASVEGGAAALAYRFSMPSFGPAMQALYWLILVPLSGIFWIRVLTLTAPYYGGANRDFPWSLVRFSLTGTPLILPVLYVAWAAAFQGGFSLERLRATALLQHTPDLPGWIFWVYLVLGLASLVWHVAVYRRIFEISGRAALRHWLTSLALFLLAATGAGALLFYPVQRWITPWL
jgi:hypothetical protein